MIVLPSKRGYYSALVCVHRAYASRLTDHNVLEAALLGYLLLDCHRSVEASAMRYVERVVLFICFFTFLRFRLRRLCIVQYIFSVFQLP